MAVDCSNCPLRELDVFMAFSAEEIRFMERFKVGELNIDAGTTILLEGSNSPQLFTVLKGQGLRYKLLEDGRRQVLNFVFPGDLIGLQAGIMGEMGHSVEATSQMSLCVFDRGGIWSLFKSYPERAYDLTWLAASEEHFLGETLAVVGQRTAIQAVAWALVRLYERAGSLGMLKNGNMPLPYRQQDLADALGLSLVHTNKTLARLRDLQLANWTEGELHINDIEKLAELAVSAREGERRRPLL
ncbi:Crp/Fnr family transcriptional regulator [Sulfitobacter sp. D35]|uniref:Crp/Fnr family transcriptional regulator n=1 Tax=Sulfitobacter sp. D35 TaxID=3083252 RepID=UPI00296FE607|nr:Crp/Fnr family transcriptional regulator [Sulfitobacter sp. D35]MDW4499905.1 Crp/Fnr family transcriptional regulator [Sulfitobacter sp. D35]